ncbi:uncharacterized protein LOC128228994 [Mya arenaria]|uniref:uncharacterized protein LOC128228994 n=1 Tax=Mya arenaria TaxID=6604 RepID=UPI0022E08D3F|nr:uncharacterized protein LOC128228994 [Mya arenaria]XP_052796567.1 uncharacterized protein LOC128228994 [Mya arenaria]XP_052796568.1 uncharacterized protein LOC128228994 [Mya arenaria]XP_052796569.1 uncharacterized protein LOC128228994 [Mya arenaria]XP_052796570.1 uncharacterized protein LOC128228994 [Mya arenaria]
MAQRGQAVIIVNKNFPNHKSPRKGATKDIKKMFKLFTLLDFRVKPYWNLKGEEMRKVITKACEHKSNKDSECFVLVISSHGREDVNAKTGSGDVVHEHVVLGTDDGVVLVEHILKEMENPTLKGTQKLCFFQACRVSTHRLSIMKDGVDSGVNVKAVSTVGGGSGGSDGGKGNSEGMDVEDIVDSLLQDLEKPKEEDTAENECTVIEVIDPLSLPDTDDESEEDEEVDTQPLQDSGHPPLPPPRNVVPNYCPRDCLVMYPVQPHKYAFRSLTKGSWMLYFLYKNKEMLLNENENLSLLQYLTKVAADLAARDYNWGSVKELQMAATIVHRLTADVRFQPFEHGMMSRFIQKTKTKAGFFRKHQIVL